MKRVFALSLLAAMAAFHPGCSSTASSSAEMPSAATPAPVRPGRELFGPTWSLRTLEGRAITVPDERARPTLNFNPEQARVSGVAAVNRYGGTYIVGATELKLGPLMATKMAATAPELNDLETRFLRGLERVTAWRLVDGELELLAGSEVVARFVAQP